MFDKAFTQSNLRGLLFTVSIKFSLRFLVSMGCRGQAGEILFNTIKIHFKKVDAQSLKANGGG